MENMYLPPEYQQELEKAQRQQRMAQMLFQRSGNFQGAQSQGRIASKTSPLAWLANLGTMGLANYSEGKAAEQMSGVRKRAGEAEQGELQRLQSLPMDQAILEGERSVFPTGRSWAKTAREKQQKMLEGGMAALNAGGDYGGAFNAAKSGVLPDGVNPPVIPEPVERRTADGSPYLLTKNRRGEPNVNFAPKGTVVNNNLPGQEGAMAIDRTKAELGEWRESAKTAKQIYATTTQAVDALERGAKPGGLGTSKQALREILQGFKIDVPNTAETAELSMALGNTLLSEAQKIKPISNTDIDTLRKIVGSISTDPTALTRALAFSQGLAMEALMNFQEYGKTKEAALTNPAARELFAGWNIGLDAPQSLSGPAPFQFEVIRSLQNRGFDISKFKDPEGKPFPQNAKIQMDPTGGFPGVAKPAQKNPAPMNGLTPEEQAELLELRRRLQGGKQ